MRGGAEAPAAWIESALIVFEVKQQSRERFQIAGTEIFPMYGRTPSKRSVSKQVTDATIGALDFVKRYSDQRIFVHGLAWLTDMPRPNSNLRPALLLVAMRHGLQCCRRQRRALRCFSRSRRESIARAIETVGNVLSRRRRAAAHDRAAVDRLTKAAIAEGKFDDIQDALGRRQIRLAGRAGSGKSTTLALLAEYIARVRQERLLVLTYNHALCHEIDRLIRSVVNDDALVDRHVRVATLVDFLADAGTELGADIPNVDGQIDYQGMDDALSAFVATASPDEIRADAEVLKELEPQRFGFDYVCVDEAQDCLDPERDLLRILYPTSSLVLADGLEQLIRRQMPCDWTTDIKKDARLHVDLSQSLRMPRNIAEFATATARAMGLDGWRITPHPDLLGGRIIVVAGSYDRQLLQELIGSLDDSDLPRKDLLICVPPSEIVANGASRDSRIAKALQSWDYETWNGCDEIVRRTEAPELDRIRVVQYDSMRGLEGWSTMLVGLDAFYSHRLAHPNLKAGDRTTVEQVAQRWMLMAITRAAHTLTITLDDPGSAMAAWLRTAAATLPREVVEWRES
jgi:hypothetical protein